jgi:hypothetical protein
MNRDRLSQSKRDLLTSLAAVRLYKATDADLAWRTYIEVTIEDLKEEMIDHVNPQLVGATIKGLRKILRDVDMPQRTIEESKEGAEVTPIPRHRQSAT